MTFQGALVTEQGVTFAIVVVKQHVIQNSVTAQRTQAAFTPRFPGVPIILMAQNYLGEPTYYGRRDLVDFLAHVPMECIPWREYQVA